MRGRPVSRAAGLVLCLAGIVGCAGDEGPAVLRGSERPSVVLITMDTTRADQLEPYGATEVATPTLAALADEGIVFEHAVATVPVTAPSHASLLTGLYPAGHGVRDNTTHYLRPEAQTMAEILADAGYRTGAFVSTVILDRRFGLDQGFEHYDDEIRAAVSTRDRRTTVERSARATTDRALAWLEGLDGAAPFFLWVHYYDPHIPYAPPSPWAESYPDRPYEGEIAFMDAQIGRLLEHPRMAADRTIVTAIGDHGESLGEHGEKTHGLLIYDSTIRVPWILRVPGGKAGLRVAAPVSQVDLLPTLVEMLSADEPPAGRVLDGQSLMPLIRGDEGRGERSVFSETEVPFFAYGWSRLRSVRRGDLKLIDAPAAELYDLRADPGERTNLAGDRDDEQRVLEAELDEWKARGEASAALVSVDAGMLRELRALGYVAGDPSRPEGEGRGNPVELMPVHDELQVIGRLLSSGEAVEAVERARAALEMDPDNNAALRDLSRGLVLLGQLDEAAAAAHRASTAAPWSTQALTLEADVEHRRGRTRRALELVDAALALDERFLEARIDRGRYLAALGQTEAARAELEALLVAAPDDNWVALRYAEIVELGSGRNEAAEQRLRGVISRNPAFTEAWLLLGKLLAEAGRGGELLAAYRESAVAEAVEPAVLGRLSVQLADSRDPAAEDALRAALTASPSPPAELHVALARLLGESGRQGEARAQLELALAARAASIEDRNARASALLHLGRVDEAEAVWRGLVRDRPGFTAGWVNLGSLLMQRGRWSEAESCARKAIEREPGSAAAWNTIAVALDELERDDEAEAAYRRAAELDPRDWRPLFNLGILLRSHARYDEAATTQEQVLMRSPGNGGAHFELGVLWAAYLGDAERARRHLRACIDSDPDSPRAQQARQLVERLR